MSLDCRLVMIVDHKKKLTQKKALVIKQVLF